MLRLSYNYLVILIVTILVLIGFISNGFAQTTLYTINEMNNRLDEYKSSRNSSVTSNEWISIQVEAIIKELDNMYAFWLVDSGTQRIQVQKLSLPISPFRFHGSFDYITTYSDPVLELNLTSNYNCIDNAPPNSPSFFNSFNASFSGTTIHRDKFINTISRLTLDEETVTLIDILLYYFFANPSDKIINFQY